MSELSGFGYITKNLGNDVNYVTYKNLNMEIHKPFLLGKVNAHKKI